MRASDQARVTVPSTTVTVPANPNDGVVKLNMHASGTTECGALRRDVVIWSELPADQPLG